MIRCRRCCLHKSMRIVNIVVNFFGTAMIIYSLWLLKKWLEGVADLSLPPSFPRPWFIYTCLGIGIIVCLSTLSGHMVANCISNTILALYIFTIFSLLIVQGGIIISTLFQFDWESCHGFIPYFHVNKPVTLFLYQQIAEHIDKNHESFKNFILFHLRMCQTITISALVAQINVVVLAVIFWTVGGQPMLCGCIADPPNFSYSFLADYNSPLLDDPGPRETIVRFYKEGLLRKSFHQLTRIGS